MSLWTNTDNTAGKPKYLNDTDKVSTVGVDVTEAKQTENRSKGIKTPGWTKHETYENAQGIVRNKTEILVAFGGTMTGDADVAAVVNRLLSIATQPVAQSVEVGAPATFTVVASATPTASLTYKWQTNGGSGTSYTDITDDLVYSGAATDTLTIADSTGLDGYKYRVVVSSADATSKTSTAVTLTVA